MEPGVQDRAHAPGEAKPSDGLPRGSDAPLREVELPPPPAAAPHLPARHMRILGLQSTAEILDEALDEALASLGPSLPEDRMRVITDRARRAFLARLRAKGRRVRGMAKSAFLVELERSKSDLLVARDRVRSELAGLVGRRDLLQEISGGPEGTPHAPVEGELRLALRKLLALARDPGSDLHVLESVGLAELVELLSRGRAAELDVNERRIAKLAEALAESERALLALARLKDVDPGIPSIYRTVQGLEGADALANAKHEALERIFQANLALRNALAALPERPGALVLPG